MQRHRSLFNTQNRPITPNTNYRLASLVCFHILLRIAYSQSLIVFTNEARMKKRRLVIYVYKRM